MDLKPRQRRKRKQTYDGQVSAPLAKIWEIFDCPCGQRLKPILEVELDRLREFGEIRVCEDVALRLKTMSSATIDRKLKHQREVLHLLRSKGGPKPGSLLKRKIPIRLTEWDTSKTGYVEMDLVIHCGSSTFGEYINTLSTTEVSSGWWEGEAIMGKSQQVQMSGRGRLGSGLKMVHGQSDMGRRLGVARGCQARSGEGKGKRAEKKCTINYHHLRTSDVQTSEVTFQALKQIRGRAPFDLKGLDSDNGSEFINDILYKYCCREKLEFTRSRPSRKNDNAYIEQKNWTHARKILGYLRYDTLAELSIINDLYRGDFRLYKNFFQPVMKLVSKERIGGSVKRTQSISLWQPTLNLKPLFLCVIIIFDSGSQDYVDMLKASWNVLNTVHLAPRR